MAKKKFMSNDDYNKSYELHKKIITDVAGNEYNIVLGGISMAITAILRDANADTKTASDVLDKIKESTLMSLDFYKKKYN